MTDSTDDVDWYDGETGRDTSKQQPRTEVNRLREENAMLLAESDAHGEIVRQRDAYIGRLRDLAVEWMLFCENVMPSDAAGYDWLDGLRKRTCTAIAAGRGERAR